MTLLPSPFAHGSMHCLRGSGSHHPMQTRMPKGLLHVAEALRAGSRPCCSPASAARHNGAEQLLPSLAQTYFTSRAANLTSEQRGTAVRGCALSPAVSLQKDPAAVSVQPSAAANGAHAATPADLLDASVPQDNAAAPHTPVLLREVLRPYMLAWS